MSASSAAGKSPVDWATILVEAVSKPGVISKAYSQFWNYSIGNQLLAVWQCHFRGIEPGPLNTFPGWKNIRRVVRIGEKALTLCMPVILKKKGSGADASTAQSATGSAKSGKPNLAKVRKVFIFRSSWFVLSQTEGDPYMPATLPAWNEERALAKLNIKRIPFTLVDGNVQGYALLRNVSVSPIAHQPHRTLLHEVAHVVLGHTLEGRGMSDGDERTPRDIREVEAECVALICSECLGLPGEEFSRGYIQHWLRKQPISEKSIHRIFKTADMILRAGRPDEVTENVEVE